MAIQRFRKWKTAGGRGESLKAGASQRKYLVCPLVTLKPCHFQRRSGQMFLFVGTRADNDLQRGQSLENLNYVFLNISSDAPLELSFLGSHDCLCVIPKIPLTRNRAPPPRPPV